MVFRSLRHIVVLVGKVEMLKRGVSRRRILGFRATSDTWMTPLTYLASLGNTAWGGMDSLIGWLNIRKARIRRIRIAGPGQLLGTRPTDC